MQCEGSEEFWIKWPSQVPKQNSDLFSLFLTEQKWAFLFQVIDRWI